MATRIGRIVCRGGLALLMCGMLSATLAWADPSLVITSPPAFMQRYSSIYGYALGVSPADYYVAPFIFIPGSGWHSKPVCDVGRVVGIDSYGMWSAYTYTGGDGSLDNLATMVAAYLIPKSSFPACYPDCVQGAHCIPAALIAASVASDRALCPGQRTISWSGYDWYVRSSQGGGNIGQVGPGNNYFFDACDSVWVDADGKLHLRINYANGRWNSAAIVSAHRLGYGTYRFYCDSRLDNLDRYATLGMFTYTDVSCVAASREIDLEFTTWGDSILPNNAQYVIQPSGVNGNMFRYTMTSTPTSTHSFTWRPEAVSFSSVEGHCASPNSCTPISSWEFSRQADVPASADERLYLNLWLNNSTPGSVPGPSNGQPVEVVISRFEFVPYYDPLRPVVGLNSRAFQDPVAASAAGKHTFRLWGRILSKDCGGLTLSDGGPQPARILDPGHTFAVGDCITADGTLTGTSPKQLDTSAGRIRLVK